MQLGGYFFRFTNGELCPYKQHGMVRERGHCKVSPHLSKRGGFSAGAGRGLSLHLRGCFRNSDPHKVDDMVQVGQEVGAREPAVMAVLLNARFLETGDTNINMANKTLLEVII